MAMEVVAVNYLAVLVAAIVGFFVGFVWYAQPVFGKMWMQWSGISDKKMKDGKKSMGLLMLGGFISQLVMAYVIAMLVGFTGATTFVTGMITAFWAWLGFVATVLLGSVLWEGKPFKLYILNAAHYIVVMALMGGILAVWV